MVVAELRQELLLRRIPASDNLERRSRSDRVTGRDRPETEQAPWGAALDVAVNLDSARLFRPLPYGATIVNCQSSFEPSSRNGKVATTVKLVLEGQWGGDHRLECVLTTAPYFFNPGPTLSGGRFAVSRNGSCEMVV